LLHNPLFLPTPPAPTHTSTLSLHDALPISLRNPPQYSPRPDTAPPRPSKWLATRKQPGPTDCCCSRPISPNPPHTACATMCARRSEEHTFELQSRENLVCRLLLEKKKNKRQ